MKAKIKTGDKVRRSGCPVACALDVIGDRWTLLIVRDLLKGKKRYNGFIESAENIPTNILTDRLRKLEREGLIEKTLYSEHPPRAEYHLTASGQDLGKVVKAMYEWGRRHALEKHPSAPS